MKVVINATNLHVGGGVQVAVSVIDELSRFDAISSRVDILVSEKIDSELTQIGCVKSRYRSFQVYNSYGISCLWSGLRQQLKRYDVVLTIFGPLYQCRMPKISIVGFAQAWIIYPENEVQSALSIFQKIKARVKFKLQEAFFRRSSAVVVELAHVRDMLIRRGIKSGEKVFLAHNCISRIYYEPEFWQPLKHKISRDRFNIGFLGRNYIHKNTGILPRVRRLLKEQYGLNVEFYVTFNEDEWANTNKEFRHSVQNLGSLRLAQCPSFYKEMDAVIFPSLLECFSVTPLEALALRKPLFASDRNFVRDICGDFALYFDPLKPESIAAVIAIYIQNQVGKDQERLAAAAEHVKNFSNARTRALQYAAILEQYIDKS